MDIDNGGDGGYFPNNGGGCTGGGCDGGQGGYFPGGSNGGQGGFFPGQGGRNPYQPPNIFNSGFSDQSGDNTVASLNDENMMNEASNFAEETIEEKMKNLQN